MHSKNPVNGAALILIWKLQVFGFELPNTIAKGGERHMWTKTPNLTKANWYQMLEKILGNIKICTQGLKFFVNNINSSWSHFHLQTKGFLDIAFISCYTKTSFTYFNKQGSFNEIISRKLLLEREHNIFSNPETSFLLFKTVIKQERGFSSTWWKHLKEELTSISLIYASS